MKLKKSAIATAVLGVVLIGVLILFFAIDPKKVGAEDGVSADNGDLTYSISKEGDHSVLIVKDDQGNELYSDTFETDLEPAVNAINQDTIEIIYGRGDWHQSIFINGRTGQVSPVIDDVYASDGKLAVHAGFIDGQMKIIIQDIYDGEKGYEEIIDDFPPVAVGNHLIQNVTFLDDDRIKISYYTGQDVEANGWTVKSVTVSMQ